MRQDIQILRGWAVLIVVIDHAGLGVLDSGFLGVDIFFVISGFLITGIISRSIDAGSFTFGEFYFKRARRILPAAFVTILITAFLSIFSATSTEIQSLTDQIYGALTYTTNFVLWFQVDYFDVSANSKPLLHMWSLAVEEQFYIFLPIILFLVGTRFRFFTVLTVTTLSFIFCLHWAQSDPTGAFYLLPTRAWELGIGAALAIIAPKLLLTKSIARLAYYPALFLLLTIPFLPFDYLHPGFIGAAICLAAAVYIGAQKEDITRFSPSRSLARIGDISYSLYLIHWPIMVFFYSGYLGEVPKHIAVVTIPLSFTAAYLMYKLVEQPCMKAFSTPSFKHILIVPTATALVALASVLLVDFSKPSLDYAKLREPNYGLSKLCDYSGKRYQPRPECRDSENPTVFIWGDSYAMHLVPGIAKTSTVEQATFSACPPFLGFTPKRSNFDKAEVWADLCLKFNKDVLEYLKTRQEIKTVVLGSPWRLYVKEGGVVWSKHNGQFVDNNTGLEFAVREMSKTITQIRETGKRVVLFGPPPASGGDTSACLERIATGKIVFESQCEIAAKRALQYDAVVRIFLRKLGSLDGVSVVNLSDVMCGGQTCVTQKDSIPIYRDNGHLSISGSQIVFDMLGTKF